MTLDEALRQARIAVDAPHPDDYISDSTFVSRAVLRQVLDEFSATSRGVSTLPQPATITLRDQFAMHAPMAPLPDGMGGNAVEREILRNRARVALAYADAMMAARGTK